MILQWVDFLFITAVKKLDGNVLETQMGFSNLEIQKHPRGDFLSLKS